MYDIILSFAWPSRVMILHDLLTINPYRLLVSSLFSCRWPSIAWLFAPVFFWEFNLRRKTVNSTHRFPIFWRLAPSFPSIHPFTLSYLQITVNVLLSCIWQLFENDKWNVRVPDNLKIFKMIFSHLKLRIILCWCL